MYEVEYCENLDPDSYGEYGKIQHYATFAEGDILCDPAQMRCDSQRLCSGPMVSTGVGLEGLDKKEKEKILKNKGRDFSDMTVCGYWQMDNGELYYESSWNYMDYEYYRGEFDEEKNILKALSDCIKGKMNPAEYGIIYHAALSGFNERATRWLTSDFLKEYGIEKR